MNGGAYYNENDPAAARWLRWLIGQGLIAPGIVDERSIVDVEPGDLAGFTQHHFFAGIGGWSLACRLAGWPDDRPLWTASCPCQPFSVAGKGAGEDDPRHLWPHVLRLSSAARPAVLRGEQVAGAAGYDWFDGVAADLEGEGYACRAVDVPACAVDAPHIRSRQYWVAVADAKSGERGAGLCQDRAQCDGHFAANSDGAFNMGDAISPRLEGQRGDGDAGRRPIAAGSVAAPDGGDMADGYLRRSGQGRGIRPENGPPSQGEGRRNHDEPRHGDRPNGTFWSGAEWIVCHDGKARRTEPSIRLLVDGFPGRVVAWRGVGNAIVPPLAAEVLKALMETL